MTSGERTMNSYHSPHHWIPVAIVLAIALLTLTEALGQRTDSSAVFQGRPAMAGANGGTGAMAGPPQGGIGVQGPNESQIAVRRPAATASDAVAENRAVRNDKDIVPRDRDKGVAKDRRSVAQRAKDAVRRIVQRSRHGVSDGDIRTAGQ
jgi:hypothetical protein